MNFYTPRQTILCRPKVGGAHLPSRKWISWSPSGCSTPDPFRPATSLRHDPPHVYESERAGAGLFTVTVWSPVTTPESTVTPPLPTRVAVPLVDPRTSLIGGIGGIRNQRAMVGRPGRITACRYVGGSQTICAMTLAYSSRVPAGKVNRVTLPAAWYSSRLSC